MSYLETLTDELRRVGIAGSAAQRIVSEIKDHLACDPAAELGDPKALAHQFADELGTVRARRAGLAVFGALAIAGLLYGAAFAVGVQGFARHRSGLPALVLIGGGLALLGPQLAFVAGGLAGLRALRLRASLVASRAEAVIVARRATVGLGAGLAAMAGLALLAYHSGVAVEKNTFVVVAAGVGALALIAAIPLLVVASRLRPVASGQAGDLFDDLRGFTPPVLDGRPWRLALVVAAALAVVITAAGVLQHDPFDGAARGLADGLACLAGFGLLGRYLGLRR